MGRRRPWPRVPPRRRPRLGSRRRDGRQGPLRHALRDLSRRVGPGCRPLGSGLRHQAVNLTTAVSSTRCPTISSSTSCETAAPPTVWPPPCRPSTPLTIRRFAFAPTPGPAHAFYPAIAAAGPPAGAPRQPIYSPRIHVASFISTAGTAIGAPLESRPCRRSRAWMPQDLVLRPRNP